MMARFNAFAEAQEGRLLTQAQRLDRATAKALDGYYEAMLPLQAAFDQPGPEGETAEQKAERDRTNMQRVMALSAQFGEEPRRILEANYSANRTALAELRGVLPEAALAELRVDAALRSIGRIGLSMMRADPRAESDPSPPVVAARIRRSGALDQAGTERSRAIVDAWRIEHARAIEEYAEAMFEAAPGLGTPVAEPDPRLLRVAKSGQAVRAIEQKALRALADLAGARAAEFVAERDVNGEQGLAPVAPPDAADSVLQGLAQSPARLTGWFFRVPEFTRLPDAREIDERLALLGVQADARALIETVVAEWKSRECDTRFAPVLAAWRERSTALTAEMRGPIADAEARDRHAAARSAFDSARSATVDAYFAAEDALFADLAAALALEPEGPEITALRLTRLGLLDREASPLGEAGPALAQSIPARVRERLARNADLERMQWLDSGSTDSAECSERMTQLARRIDLADRTDDARIRSDLDGAIAALEPGDPATARALRTAAIQLRYPDLHRPSESAATQLAQALGVDGLDDAQLAQLEALKAEYDSVFESLTARMIEASERIANATPERFEESIALRENLEKLRFQRSERTEKARSEARRVLGGALASRVRGLVPSEDDELLAPKWRGPDPFRTTVGDDD